MGIPQYALQKLRTRTQLQIKPTVKVVHARVKYSAQFPWLSFTKSWKKNCDLFRWVLHMCVQGSIP
jgi:hypothetical protein